MNFRKFPISRQTLLIALNIVLMISIVVNIAIRIHDADGASRDAWWGPTGCPQPRKYDYRAISYGDTISDDYLVHMLENDLGDLESEPVHLILVPFLGAGSYKRFDQYVDRLSRLKQDGLNSVFVLYKPFGVSVPEKEWTRSQQWVDDNGIHMIADYEGDFVVRMRIYPCECIYSVIWNSSKVVIWARDVMLQDTGYWEMLDEVAHGRR